MFNKEGNIGIGKRKSINYNGSNQVKYIEIVIFTRERIELQLTETTTIFNLKSNRNEENYSNWCR